MIMGYKTTFVASSSRLISCIHPWNSIKRSIEVRGCYIIATFFWSYSNVSGHMHDKEVSIWHSLGISHTNRHPYKNVSLSLEPQTHKTLWHSQNWLDSVQNYYYFAQKLFNFSVFHIELEEPNWITFMQIVPQKTQIQNGTQLQVINIWITSSKINI